MFCGRGICRSDGEAIQFCVYVYNVQPGIIIDYATGDSRLDDGTGGSFQSTRKTYVLNTNSKTFHKPDCGSVGKIKDSNKQTFVGTREEAIKNGYSRVRAAIHKKEREMWGTLSRSLCVFFRKKYYRNEK